MENVVKRKNRTQLLEEGLPQFEQFIESRENYIKALEKSQRMKQDPAGCSDLTASLVSYTLPTIADWVDPNIGDEPSVTTPPAVIGGIIQ